MSSKNHEEIGYNLDLDLLTISSSSHISYPMRGGLIRNKEKKTIY